MLSLQKDSFTGNNTARRINIKNLTPLDNFVKKTYDNVIIEINGKSDLKELKGILEENGDTKIQIKVCRDSKIYVFSLKNPTSIPPPVAALNIVVLPTPGNPKIPICICHQ